MHRCVHDLIFDGQAKQAKQKDRRFGKYESALIKMFIAARIPTKEKKGYIMNLKLAIHLLLLVVL